ncbi:hypothetical protein B0H19DRAFT_1313555 [Mycena capillaripes]|nr:hypothetical protein B0H19DRAFT_1313555 [Mycena capillaripes]
MKTDNLPPSTGYGWEKLATLPGVSSQKKLPGRPGLHVEEKSDFDREWIQSPGSDFPAKRRVREHAANVKNVECAGLAHTETPPVTCVDSRRTMTSAGQYDESNKCAAPLTVIRAPPKLYGTFDVERDRAYLAACYLRGHLYRSPQLGVEVEQARLQPAARRRELVQGVGSEDRARLVVNRPVVLVLVLAHHRPQDLCTKAALHAAAGVMDRVICVPGPVHIVCVLGTLCDTGVTSADCMGWAPPLRRDVQVERAVEHKVERKVIEEVWKGRNPKEPPKLHKWKEMQTNFGGNMW